MNLNLLHNFYFEHKSQIELLITKIIQFKKTSFQQDDEVLLLEKSGILIFKDNEYSINDCDDVTYSISKFLLEKYKLGIPNDYEAAIKSFEIIEESLKGNSPIFGLRELENRINAFWFVYLTNDKGLNLANFIKEYLNKEPNYRVYELSEQVGIAFPNLHLSKEKQYEILTNIIEKREEPSRNLYDLCQKVRSYCKINENGYEFWHFIVENGNEDFEGIVTYGLLGLYERNQVNFELLTDLFKQKKWLYACLHAASHTKIFNNKHLNELFEIVYSIRNEDIKIFQQITFFYSRIVEENFIHNQSISLASQKLLEYSKSEDSKTQCIVLSNIQFLDNNDSLKYEIMNNANLEDANVLSYIKKNIYAFEDLNYFFKILKKCVLHLKTEFEPNQFEHSISMALQKDKIAFEKGIIELLIDDLGIVRWAANRIIMNKQISFETDFCQYDESQQNKILQALFVFYTDYKCVMKLILPLRKTNYTSVMKLLIRYIERLIFDYSGSAVEELTNQLKEENDKPLLEHIEKHKTALFNYIDTKIAINEFNPHLSMAKMVNDFYLKFNERTAETMTEAEENPNAFHNFFSKIIVARGRGFKISGSNTGISPMTTISHGFTLPRTGFISPEKLDWITGQKIAFNYKNDIKEHE